MRPVELVPPVPGKTSTGPADMVAAVEVRPSEGTELGQYLSIQNGTLGRNCKPPTLLVAER